LIYNETLLILFKKIDKIESMLSTLMRSDYDSQKGNFGKYDEIMNMESAAEFLDISKTTLYKHTSQRLIPHSKTGKRIYFKKTDLVNWVTKNKIKTVDEIEQEASNYIIRNRRKW